jgi:hypothetical protein
MKLVLLGLVLVLAGCATIQPEPYKESRGAYSNTMEIIRSAAGAAPDGVEGEYILKIKAAGNQGPFVYLNTEFDYRDQRSVTVAIHPRLVPLFVKKYGVTPQEYFINKSIVVYGQAKRVRINFVSQNKPSNKYYYQTHIMIMDMAQIKVLDELA